MTPIRLLILGTGAMAEGHAAAFGAMAGVTLAGAVDVDEDRLTAFADTFGIETRHAGIEEALEAGGFDAVTNVTPDAVHYATTMPVLAAGLPILCEKPLATNAAHATAMAEAADLAGVTNMVNLSYRNVPALTAARDLIARGKLGELRHFDAAYLQSWLTQPTWGDWRTDSRWLWRLSTRHGSAGVMGDVGVHIVDFLTYAAGQDIARLSCRMTTFPKAENDRIGEYVLDANDSMAMHAALSGGASGVIHASRFATGHMNDLHLRLYGTEGALELIYTHGSARLSACLGPEAMAAAEWTPVRATQVPSNFERFIAAVRQGEPVAPDFRRGAALQQVIDLAVRSDAEGGKDLAVTP